MVLSAMPSGSSEDEEKITALIINTFYSFSKNEWLQISMARWFDSLFSFTPVPIGLYLSKLYLLYLRQSILLSQPQVI
jgi:hypothetical protein